MTSAENSDVKENILMKSLENKTLSQFQRQLCAVQGRLFENSAKQGFESEAFINTFMKSKTAEFFDLPFDRTQWGGEENLLYDIQEETKNSIPKGTTYSNESLFWTGYLYRYWHFLTGQSSNEINSICDAKMMNTLFPGYHALDCGMAIERILEGKNK